MSRFSAVEAGPRLVIKRGRGRWIVVARGGPQAWPIVAECLLMMVLSCAIVALGGEVGFYANRGGFDAQSRRFAEASMTDAISDPRLALGPPSLAPEQVSDAIKPALNRVPKPDRVIPGRRLEGCFGASRLELFNPGGFIFASYACEIAVGDGLAVANIGLRRDPDAWKVTGLYISSPRSSRP